MRRSPLLAAALVSFALAGMLACSALAEKRKPVTQAEPATTPLSIVVPIGNCPKYYPCDVKFASNPQFALGTDPLCYGSSPCETSGVAPNPIPQAEANTLAVATWAVMRRKVDSGEIKDLRGPEQVPLRWADAPTVSFCFSAFRVENPVCMGDAKKVCTGKVSWVTAKPYEACTYRVAIRADVDADTQRVLVVDGTVNLALMFLNHTDSYNGPIGAAVKLQLLGK